jgi:hypothetical protein
MGWKWTQLLWLCTRITTGYVTWHIVAWGLECSISTFGRKWHIARFSFSAMYIYFTTSAYFHAFILIVSVGFHDVVSSKSHLNHTFKINSIPIFRELILMDILHCSTKVTVCALFIRYLVEKYFFSLVLQPQFGPWPISMKLSVSFQPSRS